MAVAGVLLVWPCTGGAQMTWQPEPPPPVTAENTSWFQSAEPLIWNGDLYYPAGARQGFNPYQMVRSGSFRGIPLYIDATLEPNSIVFVALAGGRMQPYERRRAGALAGTTGSRTPSLPTEFAIEGNAAAPRQAAAPPSYTAAYEMNAIEQAGSTTNPAPPPDVQPSVPVGTTGQTQPAPPGPVTSIEPPTGENAIWINYAGQRWYLSGRAIAYSAARLDEIGSYRGWTVYALRGEKGTIYIPSTPGRLAPYRKR